MILACVLVGLGIGSIVFGGSFSIATWGILGMLVGASLAYRKAHRPSA